MSSCKIAKTIKVDKIIINTSSVSKESRTSSRFKIGNLLLWFSLLVIFDKKWFFNRYQNAKYFKNWEEKKEWNLWSRAWTDFNSDQYEFPFNKIGSFEDWNSEDITSKSCDALISPAEQPDSFILSKNIFHRLEHIGIISAYKPLLSWLLESISWLLTRRFLMFCSKSISSSVSIAWALADWITPSRIKELSSDRISPIRSALNENFQI